MGEQAAVPRMRSADCRILVVEDEPQILNLVQLALSQFGYGAVAVAKTIKESRAKLEPGQFDLLITDLSLPDGNGLAFGVEGLQKDLDLKVILMTGKWETDITLPPGIGARIFLLRKPFGIH
jgi:two-component system cell cycle response regulator